MSRDGVRNKVPAVHADPSTWASVDISQWPREKQNAFNMKQRAIAMYLADEAFDEIESQTGILPNEVYRALRRCLSPAPDGRIFGFRALVPGKRVKKFERNAEINHAKGDGSGGCAGALSQLFQRFPEVESLVVNLYCKRGSRNTMHEARIGFTDIHSQFKGKLRQLGFTDENWPFNTNNVGYKSLYIYCQNLRLENAQSTMSARGGEIAVLRASADNGEKRMLPALRPYGAVQLDFHKVDAASVFILKNDFGKEFEIPLSRWHFALVVEEHSRAALGYAVVLERTPSADSTLEAISNALSSRMPDFSPAFATDNGGFVINQLMPELEYQGFSILKVDNAWSNAAHEVVNNIIDTVGCAVNFGPCREWIRRDLIEKIFGELTRRGLQRLPSTYGSGPGDTRIDNASEQAAKFRITIEDLVGIFQNCIQEHNLKSTEGRQFTEPIHILKNSLALPKSGFFQQPLPAAVRANARLMMHIEEVTVRGNLKKNKRPYFKLDRQVHTNTTLANAYRLVGKRLIIYMDRRLARVVYAVVKDTGEELGLMSLSGPWKNSNCCRRDRKMIINKGLALNYSKDGEDPIQAVKKRKEEELRNRKKSQSKRTSTTALDLVRMEANERKVVNIPTAQTPPISPIAQTKTFLTLRPKLDRFGLGYIPDID